MLRIMILFLCIIGFFGFGIFIMIHSYGLFLDAVKGEKGDKDEFNNSIK